jgi:hypothetical protein
MVSSRDTALIAYPLGNKRVTVFGCDNVKAIIFLSQKLSTSLSMTPFKVSYFKEYYLIIEISISWTSLS